MQNPISQRKVMNSGVTEMRGLSTGCVPAPGGGV